MHVSCCQFSHDIIDRSGSRKYRRLIALSSYLRAGIEGGLVLLPWVSRAVNRQVVMGICRNSDARGTNPPLLFLSTCHQPHFVRHVHKYDACGSRRCAPAVCEHVERGRRLLSHRKMFNPQRTCHPRGFISLSSRFDCCPMSFLACPRNFEFFNTHVIVCFGSFL